MPTAMQSTCLANDKNDRVGANLATGLLQKTDELPPCVVVEGCMQTPDWPDDIGMNQDCAVKPEREFGRVG